MRILEFLGLRKAERTINNELQRKYEPLNIGYSSPVYSESNVNNYIDKGYLYNSNVYAVLNFFIMKFASIPLAAYKVVDERKLKDYKRMTAGACTDAVFQRSSSLRTKALGDEVDNNSEIGKLLMKPNDYQGQDAFISSIIAYRLIAGEAFIWANRGGIEGGKAVELVVIPPQCVEVIPEQNDVFGVAGYVFNMDGFRHELKKEDVLHWKSFNPDFSASTRSHLRGVSPLMSGWRDIEADNATVDSDASIKQNKGAIGMIFPKQGLALNPEQATDFEKRLSSKINGSGNAGRIAFGQTEYGYIQLSLSPTELQLIESRGVSMRSICNLFGVPPVLFDSENSSYNNYNTAIKAFITQTVVPYWSQLRDELNRFLLPIMRTGSDVYINYDISNLPELATDLKALKDTYFGMWQFTPNEIRVLFGEEELKDENMNKIYVPSGIVPIEQLNDVVDDTLTVDEDALIKRGLV